MSDLALDRVRGAWHAAGLMWEDKSGGVAVAQAPGHTTKDRSVALRQIDGQLLMHCHAGEDTADVLAEVGLTIKDLFDNKTGVEYRYPGGSIATRSITKEFRQRPVKGDNTLFHADQLPDDTTVPVYIVEGEKDVLVAETVGAAAVSTRQGAQTKAARWDWTPLAGRPVIVVQDKDEPGEKHAHDVIDALDSITSDVRLTEADIDSKGADLSDHIMAGKTLEQLVPIDAPRVGRRINLTPASQVKTGRVRWAMDDWIPCGQLTLLAGREGIGKSTIAVDLAAKVSLGTLDGELAGTPGNVLYVHTEDSREHTVKPRLVAAGADLDRVFFVDVATEYSDTSTLVLPHDLAALEQVVADNHITLIVLDAATSAMSSELSGRDDRDVRRFLEPLAAMADRQDCVVLGLCHFGKRDGADSGKLILGSIAWSQVARSVLSAALDDETGELIVTNTKGNLAKRTRSESARIVTTAVEAGDGMADVGRIEWTGETDRDARDLLNSGAERGDADERNDAEQILLEIVADNGGSVDAKEAKKEAKAAGLSDAVINRARVKAKIKTSKTGFGGGWVWSYDFTNEDRSAPRSHEDREDRTHTRMQSSQPSVQSSATLAPVQPSCSAAESAVLDALDTTYGLEYKSVLSAVPVRYRDDTKELLGTLQAVGIVRYDGQKYYRTSEAA